MEYCWPVILQIELNTCLENLESINWLWRLPVTMTKHESIVDTCRMQVDAVLFFLH